jgi:hypothetical protein
MKLTFTQNAAALRSQQFSTGSHSRGLVAFFLFLTATTLARAEVVRFEITQREPFAEGQSFGDVGAYERIIGKVYYAIDPKLQQNENIVDLPLAARNEQGRVEFSADLFILAPRDLSKGNRAVLYDVNNRGIKLALRFFNDTAGGNDPQTAGNGFLMRQGFTVVWSGWTGELLPGDNRLQLSAPVARDGGQPITGPVRYEIVAEKETQRLNVNRDNHGAYRPTDRGQREATLTWRLRPGEERVPIPREQFRLHVSEVESQSPGQLPHVELELPAGFQPGYLYDLIYEAQDPLVHGVCFAAVRDLMSALKHGEGQSNPLLVNGKPAIEVAYGFGVSQSGRFLRELLYSGFNEDERGRSAFDGLMPHVAGGGLGSFNHRFAQPSAFVTQHEHHDWHTDRFPFAYETQKDPLSGRTDGILRRSQAQGKVPLVMHTQSAAEYWSRSGSLVHTDPLGTRDAEVPDNVRVYAFGGTQHGPSVYPPEHGLGQSLANPGDYRPLLRALLVSLDRWTRDGVPPPPSVYPTLREKTLVAFDQSSTGFPAIPGVRYPEVIQQPALLDLGPRWLTHSIIDQQPPQSGDSYKVLVAKSGPDGNELGCLLPPEVAVPLATFTGWNLRSRQAGAENELVSLSGSYILLPATKSQRESSGDPRLSIEERYGTLPQYTRQLAETCETLVKQRYLLAEDVQPILARQQERAKPLFEQIESP